MGRAMVREPTAFLMDEPLSNLDAKLRVQMRSELARLHDRLRRTTLYVTHDQVEAMTLGDRVAVLRAGVLQQVDTPQNLFNRPANVFVGAFIGSPAMNLVEAMVSRDTVRFASFELPTDGRAELQKYDGRRVIVGIRPSDFEDGAVVRNSELPEVEVVVEVVEDLGSEKRVIFPIHAPPVRTAAVRAAAEAGDDEGELALVHDDAESGSFFTAQVAPFSRACPGKRLRLTLDVGRLHFFDPDTGSAIGAPRLRETLSSLARTG